MNFDQCRRVVRPMGEKQETLNNTRRCTESCSEAAVATGGEATSSSASGELWGVHFMPNELTVDVLLPNGIVIPLYCCRNFTLQTIKANAWKQARGLPLFNRMQLASTYVFVIVGRDGQVEEVYDESRRLCDLRLLWPVLRLIEPDGNVEERSLSSQISQAIGRPLSDLDESRDPELIQARIQYFRLCQEVCSARGRDWNEHLLRTFCEPVVAGDDRVVIADGPPPPLPSPLLLLCVWIQPGTVGTPSVSEGHPHKITMKVPTVAKPSDVIRETLLRWGRLSNSARRSSSSVAGEIDQSSYVLKRAGRRLYFLRDVPLVNYEHVTKCLGRGQRLVSVVLVEKSDLPEQQPAPAPLVPSYVKRQSTASANDDLAGAVCMWNMHSRLRIKIVSAYCINVSSFDAVYVNAGVFFGPDALCVRRTSPIASYALRWNELLEFDLPISCIPLSAHVSFTLCTVRPRKPKDEQHCPLAWVNLRLIDHRHLLIQGRVSLYMWPFGKDFDGMFNQLGQSGPNPSRDVPCLQVDFGCQQRRVRFPTPIQRDLFLAFFQKRHRERQAKKLHAGGRSCRRSSNSSYYSSAMFSSRSRRRRRHFSKNFLLSVREEEEQQEEEEEENEEHKERQEQQQRPEEEDEEQEVVEEQEDDVEEEDEEEVEEEDDDDDEDDVDDEDVDDEDVDDEDEDDEDEDDEDDQENEEQQEDEEVQEENNPTTSGEQQQRQLRQPFPVISEEDRKFIVEDLLNRDPLHEIIPAEKSLVWRCRHFCQTLPPSLPRLLDAVTWTCTEQVCELYSLLVDWPVVEPDVALELLDVKYPDTYVRQFAVRCLDMRLSDDQLAVYLIYLVQALKYEPFLQSDLGKFLLRRALLKRAIGQRFFWLLRVELEHSPSLRRFALLLEAYCRGCGAHYLKSLVRQVNATEKLATLNAAIKDKKDDGTKLLWERLRQADYAEALQNLDSPLDHTVNLGTLLVDQCHVIGSAKRPILLVWRSEPTTGEPDRCVEILFKTGDDIRQDMLTLQVLRIMDNIWKSEGNDFCLTPYDTLPMGKRVGMIEVVKRSKTILEIQTLEGRIGAFNVGSSTLLHRYIRNNNNSNSNINNYYYNSNSNTNTNTTSNYNYNYNTNNNTTMSSRSGIDFGNDRYDAAVRRFTRSCAGYCVATFVLGIGDRHPSNIMITDDGRIFHIDFGHFLGHYKKKLGITRERVPFVLTEDFLRIIAKGADNVKKSKEFEQFQRLCSEAYLILHRQSRLFVTLFTMMLCMGIPELQKLEDVNYLRKTLAVDKTDPEALKYFNERLNEAYEGGWTTKVDWFFHSVKHL
ncbi:Phosphatidylinositol 4,5-bisphosphate 3-kinase catalytic subunit alpha isoform [Trichinella sp. T6]|nr:Phosphatidylinositol 4,5-bisphosphate 3-kinase catalytic subunit alpha isoform [Trichinella sp. T6]